VYGIAAYADRAAAVGEVHAPPRILLLRPPGGKYCSSLSNDEGDQARDQMAMADCSHRSRRLPEPKKKPRYAAYRHGHGMRETFHCEKHTSSLSISGALRWIPRRESLPEKSFKLDLSPSGRSNPDIRFEDFPFVGYRNGEEG